MRMVCPACGWVDYLLPKPSAGVLIEADGRLLLVQRDIEPWKGSWCLPAGYMEIDETPIQTAEREALEETGLMVRVARLLDVYYFDDDPRSNGVLILFQAEIVGGTLRGSAEGRQLRFFAPEEIPQDLAGGADDRIIHAWAASRRQGG